MVGKGRKKGTTRFAIKPPQVAKRAQLAGEFTGWEPVTMRRQKDGTFVVIVPLPLGTYEYKFVVDGQWQLDPDNHSWAPNTHGTMNSVVRVE